VSGEQPDDGLWRAIATLPTIEVDAGHAERIRARCRRAIEGHQRPATGTVMKVWTAWAANAWQTLSRLLNRAPQAGSR
jgi:hypothetical protein